MQLIATYGWPLVQLVFWVWVIGGMLCWPYICHKLNADADFHREKAQNGMIYVTLMLLAMLVLWPGTLAIAIDEPA